jgi:agmatine deiminase
MPAEWSPHQGTWISWPHNPETWPGLLEPARDAMASAASALAQHEQVHINVHDEDEARQLERRLAGCAPPENIIIERIPTDDAWIRDYGAIFVRDAAAPGGWAAVDFGYNAWGDKYPPYDRDQAVARQMAERLGVPRLVAPLILEGGSVEVNGAGLGLVTEQCLLNPNRNPGLSRAGIEARLAEFLGLGEIVWLGAGVVGDDTDGHIDNLARFVAERRVVTIVEPDPEDVNHPPLADNLSRLRAFRDGRGQGLEIIELPVPEPILHQGTRLPASYANFYIANEVVLVPAYGGDRDAQAQAILADCFPGRRIQGIDCRALVAGLGALHCLTQQVPVMVSGSAAI